MVDFISVFGIFISILLLVFLKPHNKSNIYLSGFFFSMGSMALLRNTILYLKNETILQFFLPSLFPIFVLSAPFLYLYIRSRLSSGGYRSFSKYDFLHFIPSLIVLINFIPHFTLSSEEKTLFIRSVLVDPAQILSLKTLFFPIKFNFLLRPLGGVIYFFLMIRMLLDGQSWSNLMMKVKSDSDYQWFACLTIFMGSSHAMMAGLSIYFFNTNFDGALMDSYKFYMMFPAFITLLMNVSILFFPKILYGIFVDDQEEKTDAKVSMHAIKFKGGANVELEFKEIADSLHEYFQGKSYLKPGFNLSVITKETNIPYHKLTNYFTMYLGVNFNDWKNDIRVAHAVDLIDHGRAKNLTLESIAYSCGYLSRSNFVNAFRKKMGMTPSEYVKSIPEISLVTSAEF